MKTELRYSIIHEIVLEHGEINRAFKLKEYEKLKNKSEKFEKLYIKHIKKIIKLIEKEIGHNKWRYDFMPIYIVNLDLKNCYTKNKNKKYNWKGYGDPITILIRHEKVMLFTLIHELVHNILSLEEHVKLGLKRTERYIHYEVSQNVWDKLGLGNWRDHIKK